MPPRRNARKKAAPNSPLSLPDGAAVIATPTTRVSHVGPPRADSTSLSMPSDATHHETTLASAMGSAAGGDGLETTLSGSIGSAPEVHPAPLPLTSRGTMSSEDYLGKPMLRKQEDETQ